MFISIVSDLFLKFFSPNFAFIRMLQLNFCTNLKTTFMFYLKLPKNPLISESCLMPNKNASTEPNLLHPKVTHKYQKPSAWSPKDLKPLFFLLCLSSFSCAVNVIFCINLRVHLHYVSHASSIHCSLTDVRTLFHSRFLLFSASQ